MYTADYVETDKRHNPWLYVHAKITRVLYEVHPEIVGELTFYEANLAVFYVKAVDPESDGYRCIRGRLMKLLPERRDLVLELSERLLQPSNASNRRYGDEAPEEGSSGEDSDDSAEVQEPSASDSSSSEDERQVLEIDPRDAQVRRVTTVKAPSSSGLIYDSHIGAYIPRKEYEERSMQRFAQLSKDKQKLVMAKFKELREKKARGLIPVNYGMEGVNAFIPESKALPGSRMVRVNGFQMPDRIELVRKAAKNKQAWKRAVRQDTGFIPEGSQAPAIAVSGGGSSRFSKFIRIYDTTGKIANIASVSNYHH